MPYIFTGFQHVDKSCQNGCPLFANLWIFVDSGMEIINIQTESHRETTYQFIVEMMVCSRVSTLYQIDIFHEYLPFMLSERKHGIAEQGQFSYHIIIILRHVL